MYSPASVRSLFACLFVCPLVELLRKFQAIFVKLYTIMDCGYGKNPLNVRGDWSYSKWSTGSHFGVLL